MGTGFLDGLLAALDAELDQPVIAGLPDAPVDVTASDATGSGSCPCCALIGATPTPPPAVAESVPAPIIDATPIEAASAATDTAVVDVDAPVLVGSAPEVLDAPVMNGPVATPIPAAAPALVVDAAVADAAAADTAPPRVLGHPRRSTVVATRPSSTSDLRPTERVAMHRPGWAPALVQPPVSTAATSDPVAVDAPPALVDPPASDAKISDSTSSDTESSHSVVAAPTSAVATVVASLAQAPRRAVPGAPSPTPPPTPVSPSVAGMRARHLPTVPAIRVHDDGAVPFRAVAKREAVAVPTDGDAVAATSPVERSATTTSSPINTVTPSITPTINATPVRSAGAPTNLGMVTSNLAGVDRVRFAREQAPARAVQRLSLDLDGAQVAVRFHGERIAVDVVTDPTGSLGNGWARNVERTLDQAVRTVSEPRDTRSDHRGQPDGSSRHGGQQGEADESRQQRRQRAFDLLAEQTAGGKD